MILHLYIARKFLVTFAFVLGIFLCLNFLFDILDNLRRYSGRNIEFSQIMRLVWLMAPARIYQILPLICVIASLAVFLSFGRSRELIISRAAGRSGLRSIFAPVFAAFLLGLLSVAILNPLVAATGKQHEQEVERLAGNVARAFSFSEEGIWLRQGSIDEQIVIFAEHASMDGRRMFDVTFLVFNNTGIATRRHMADLATLDAGQWTLENVKTWQLSTFSNAEASASLDDTLIIPTELTVEQIQDRFGVPSSIAIWDLPAFIQNLEKAGFSAQRHEVWLHRELALPLVLAVTVLIVSVFTLHPARVQNTAVLVLMAVLCGFGLHFLRNFAQILGENGQLPYWLAAWSPPLVALGLALGPILHSEDG